MIIPIIRTPSGCVINLQGFVEFYDKKAVYWNGDVNDYDERPDNGCVTLEYSGRVLKRFFGEDADSVRGAVVFLNNSFQDFIAGYLAAQKQAASPIVPFNGKH